jgi:hypothetical protein
VVVAAIEAIVLAGVDALIDTGRCEFGRGDIDGNVASQLLKLFFNCCCCVCWQGLSMFSSGVSSLSLPNLNVLRGWLFFFYLLPVQWSPMASINSLFVVDSETQFNGCRSFNCKSSIVRKLSSNSPLERSKIEINSNESIVVIGVVAGGIVSPAIVFVQPLSFFEVSFRDVLFPPM